MFQAQAARAPSVRNPIAPGSAPPKPQPALPASPSAASNDTFFSSTASSSAALGAAAARERQPAALRSAAHKIVGGLDLLLSQTRGGILDAALQLFAEKSRSTDDAVGDAKTRIRDELSDKQALTKQRIIEAERSLRALESTSVWDKLALAFKAVATAASAAVAAATGGATSWITAALITASFIAPIVDPGEVGTWLGFGFGAAAAALSLGVSTIDAVAAQTKNVQTALSATQDVSNAIDRTTRTVVDLFPETFELGAKGCEIGSRVCHADSEDARARIIELKALSKKVMQEADEQREEIRELMQGMHRSAMTLVQMLTTGGQLQLRPAQMAR